jgi:hypothetical protein
MGLDLLTDWPSFANFDFDFEINIPRVEAGSNTSTVAHRLAGGVEKGSLESETVKYMVTSPTGLGTENDCSGEGQQIYI